MTTILKTLGLGLGVLCLGTAALADKDREALLANPAPAIVIAEPDRPHLIERTLYWGDHELAVICITFGGRFAKVRGSHAYACEPGTGPEGDTFEAPLEAGHDISGTH